MFDRRRRQRAHFNKDLISVQRQAIVGVRAKQHTMHQSQKKHMSCQSVFGVQAGWNLLALPVAYVGDMAKKIIANTVPCL